MEKFKAHELWLAFKDARCDYKSALYAVKTAVFSDKVISCGKDSQMLYSLVNNLLGRGKRNCLPDCILMLIWQMNLPPSFCRKWKGLKKDLLDMISMYLQREMLQSLGHSQQCQRVSLINSYENAREIL